MNKIIKNIVNDVAVELRQQINENFRQSSFYGKKWDARKKDYKHNILNRRGGAGLMGSINVKPSGNAVHVTSNLPYAAIHNEGGKITVTANMKKFFWAKHYEAKAGSEKFVRGKKKEQLSKEALYWRNMALMKIGSVITIPQRQFVGDHPQVKKMIEQVVADNLKELENYIKSHLKPKK